MISQLVYHVMYIACTLASYLTSLCFLIVALLNQKQWIDEHYETLPILEDNKLEATKMRYLLWRHFTSRYPLLKVLEYEKNNSRIVALVIIFMLLLIGEWVWVKCVGMLGWQWLVHLKECIVIMFIQILLSTNSSYLFSYFWVSMRSSILMHACKKRNYIFSPPTIPNPIVYQVPTNGD